jgi:hypothetical protein
MVRIVEIDLAQAPGAGRPLDQLEGRGFAGQPGPEQLRPGGEGIEPRCEAHAMTDPAFDSTLQQCRRIATATQA